jgi:nicotinamidase-related amidase
MPRDLTPHLDPATTAVLNMELAEGLLGPNPILPGLAASAAEGEIVDHVAALLDAARRVGVRIFYCMDGTRFDLRYDTARTDSVPVQLPDEITWSAGHGPPVAALTPHDEDVVMYREHGYTGFYTTPLDAYLRKMRIKTLIITGISLNIAVVGTAIEALNRGYQVIVPRDCVASDPAEYAESLLRFTMRNVALVAPSTVIVDYWDGL